MTFEFDIPDNTSELLAKTTIPEVEVVAFTTDCGVVHLIDPGTPLSTVKYCPFFPIGTFTNCVAASAARRSPRVYELKPVPPSFV